MKWYINIRDKTKMLEVKSWINIKCCLKAICIEKAIEMFSYMFLYKNNISTDKC